MPRRTLILINLAIVVALFIGSGAQWFVLQSVAWTNMLIQYSQTSSLGEAFEKTFDGEHPCNLCEQVQNADKQSKNDGTTQAVPNIKGVLAPRLTAIRPDWVLHRYPALRIEASPRSHRPPVRPPRASLA